MAGTISVAPAALRRKPRYRARRENNEISTGKVTRMTSGASIMPLTTKSTEQPSPGFDPLAAPAPGDGYAWWSGTSFAAAIAAGQLAARLPAGQALPEPAAGP